MPRALMVVVVAVAVQATVMGSAQADATKELWTALKGANDPAALEAIKKGVDVNNLDPAFGTPLNYASCFAGPEVIKALIDAKSNVNFVAQFNKFTPLVNALSWGNTEAVKLLLAAGANPKVTFPTGNTLTAAIASVKIELVRLILDAGVSPAAKFTLAGKETTPFLILASTTYTPKEKVANIMTNRPLHAKIGITYPPRLANAKESDFTPLDEIATLLLEKGADPNTSFMGTSAFLSAAQTGKAGVVKALIGKVDINQRSIAKRTALWFAAEKGHTEVAELLIAAKADLEGAGIVNGKTGYFASTPVMMAALNGHDAVVEALCKAGAQLNKLVSETRTTSNGDGSSYTISARNTALSLAVGANHMSTADILRKHGAKGPKELGADAIPAGF